MTRVIGLTGGIATGKSTIANLFDQKGVPVVDADLISREIVKPQMKAYQKIVTQFGQAVLSSDQTIDRKKLGKMIFNDPEKRAQLNQITHPIIIEQIIEQRDQLIKEDHPLIVLDIPLLFELNLKQLSEKILVVYTSGETQLERLKLRDQLSEEAALQRINSQIAIGKKKEEADFVIDNNGSLKETKDQFLEIFENLIKDN